MVGCESQRRTKNKHAISSNTLSSANASIEEEKNKRGTPIIHNALVIDLDVVFYRYVPSWFLYFF